MCLSVYCASSCVTNRCAYVYMCSSGESERARERERERERASERASEGEGGREREGVCVCVFVFVLKCMMCARIKSGCSCLVAKPRLLYTAGVPFFVLADNRCGISAEPRGMSNRDTVPSEFP